MSLPAQEQLKVVGDAHSLRAVVATLAGWLPAIAALFTIIWTGIRILETETVKKLLKKFRQRRE
jgi:hypothetical protein